MDHLWQSLVSLTWGVGGILSDFVVKTNGREHAYKDGDYNVMGNKY